MSLFMVGVGVCEVWKTDGRPGRTLSEPRGAATRPSDRSCYLPSPRFPIYEIINRPLLLAVYRLRCEMPDPVVCRKPLFVNGQICLFSAKRNISGIKLSGIHSDSDNHLKNVLRLNNR